MCWARSTTRRAGSLFEPGRMLSKSAQRGPHASAPDEIDKLPWIIALVVEFLAAVSLVANVDQITFSH
jgi:hypothetical protein